MGWRDLKAWERVDARRTMYASTFGIVATFACTLGLLWFYLHFFATRPPRLLTLAVLFGTYFAGTAIGYKFIGRQGSIA